MKTFNLTDAIAGEAIVTRTGLACTFIARNTGATEFERVVVFETAGKRYITASDSGAAEPYDSDDDLFMADTVKTGWVATAAIGGHKGLAASTSAYATKAEALAELGALGGATVTYNQVIWEE